MVYVPAFLLVTNGTVRSAHSRGELPRPGVKGPPMMYYWWNFGQRRDDTDG